MVLETWYQAFWKALSEYNKLKEDVIGLSLIVSLISLDKAFFSSPWEIGKRILSHNIRLTIRDIPIMFFKFVVLTPSFPKSSIPSL